MAKLKKLNLHWLVLIAVILLEVFIYSPLFQHDIPPGWDTPTYIYRSELIQYDEAVHFDDPYIGQDELPDTPGYFLLLASLSNITKIAIPDLIISVNLLGVIILVLLWYIFSKRRFGDRIALVSTLMAVVSFFTIKLSADLFKNLYGFIFFVIFLTIFSGDNENHRARSFILLAFSATALLFFHQFAYFCLVVTVLSYLAVMLVARRIKLGESVYLFSPLLAALLLLFPFLQSALLSTATEVTAFDLIRRGSTWGIDDFGAYLGYFSVVLALLGFAGLLFRHRKADVLVVVWTLSLLLLGSGFYGYIIPDRFFLMLPLPILAAGGVILVKEISTRRNSTVGGVLTALMLITIIVTTVPAALEVTQERQPLVSPGQYEAMQWLKDEVEPIDTILVTDSMHGWLAQVTKTRVLKALNVDIADEELYTQEYDRYREGAAVMTGNLNISETNALIDENKISYVFAEKGGRVASFTENWPDWPLINIDYMLENPQVFHKIFENDDVLIFQTEQNWKQDTKALFVEAEEVKLENINEWEEMGINLIAVGYLPKYKVEPGPWGWEVTPPQLTRRFINDAHLSGIRIFTVMPVLMDRVEYVSIIQQNPSLTQVSWEGKATPWLNPALPEARQIASDYTLQDAAMFKGIGTDGVVLDLLRYEWGFSFDDYSKEHVDIVDGDWTSSVNRKENRDWYMARINEFSRQLYEDLSTLDLEVWDTVSANDAWNIATGRNIIDLLFFDKLYVMAFSPSDALESEIAGIKNLLVPREKYAVIISAFTSLEEMTESGDPIHAEVVEVSRRLEIANSATENIGIFRAGLLVGEPKEVFGSFVAAPPEDAFYNFIIDFGAANSVALETYYDLTGDFIHADSNVTKAAEEGASFSVTLPTYLPEGDHALRYEITNQGIIEIDNGEQVYQEEIGIGGQSSTGEIAFSRVGPLVKVTYRDNPRDGFLFHIGLMEVFSDFTIDFGAANSTVLEDYYNLSGDFAHASSSETRSAGPGSSFAVTLPGYLPLGDYILNYEITNQGIIEINNGQVYEEVIGVGEESTAGRIAFSRIGPPVTITLRDNPDDSSLFHIGLIKVSRNFIPDPVEEILEDFVVDFGAANNSILREYYDLTGDFIHADSNVTKAAEEGASFSVTLPTYLPEGYYTLTYEITNQGIIELNNGQVYQKMVGASGQKVSGEIAFSRAEPPVKVTFRDNPNDGFLLHVNYIEISRSSEEESMEEVFSDFAIDFGAANNVVLEDYYNLTGDFIHADSSVTKAVGEGDSFSVTLPGYLPEGNYILNYEITNQGTIEIDNGEVYPEETGINRENTTGEIAFSRAGPDIIITFRDNPDDGYLFHIRRIEVWRQD